MEINWSYGEEQPEPVFVMRIAGQAVYTIRVMVQRDEERNEYKWLEVQLGRDTWSRSAIISALVRLYYSADDVEAIINNCLANLFDEKSIADYQALQEWRMMAKHYADQLLKYADDNGLSDCASHRIDEQYEPTYAQSAPDGVSVLMQAVTLIKSQVSDLPDEQAKDLPALFPAWANKIGEQLNVGDRLFYDGKLYKVLQSHVAQSDWTPDVAVSLFTEVGADAEQGTIENPIPYNGNMELESGKYYTQDGAVYRCIRSTGVPVYHALKDLVNLYVELVN